MRIKDMAYGDRFSLAVKDFGRKVVLKVNRRHAGCTKNEKLVTITYKDRPALGPREDSKFPPVIPSAPGPSA